MKLVIVRDTFLPTATLGELRLYGATGLDGRRIPDGAGEIWTCEDVDRGLDAAAPATIARKIKGATAIPVGTYRVAIHNSAHFGRRLPILLEVPGFAGILLHAGNSSADTEGCLLVGQTRDVQAGTIGRSAAMSDWLGAIIAAELGRGGHVTIEIRRDPAAWPG